MQHIPLIDCHCHIEARWFKDDCFSFRQILKRCDAFGVNTIIVSVDCASGQPEINLVQLREVFRDYHVKLAVTLGFTPPANQSELVTLKHHLEMATLWVKRLADSGELVGIGECGLDYYWASKLSMPNNASYTKVANVSSIAVDNACNSKAFNACANAQADVFRFWIQVAKDCSLPIVVHEREAHQDAKDILNECEMPSERVMWHCFSATPSDAIIAMDKGQMVSLPSSIVERERFQNIAKAIDLEHLLIETDSPCHSPISGIWKQCCRKAIVESVRLGLKDQIRERFVQDEQIRLFSKELDALFPGLTFDIPSEEGVFSAPAVEYFMNSRARFLNEPIFVRFAAIGIAESKRVHSEQVCRSLTANAKRFFGI